MKITVSVVTHADLQALKLVKSEDSGVAGNITLGSCVSRINNSRLGERDLH